MTDLLCPDCWAGQGFMHSPECPVRTRNMRAFHAGRWPLPWHVDLEAEEQALEHFAADRTPG